MPIQKQPVNINFLQGLDTKTDPYQVSVGNFLSLTNSVFDKVGRLTKRNGFSNLTSLPNDTTSYLTTFNGDLQAIGDSFLTYSPNQTAWIDKGSIYPITLSTMPLIRNSVDQVQADIAINNGLICTVYTETPTISPSFKYAVADATTGQNIVEPTVLPNANASYGFPKVFSLGNYFLIIYTTGTTSYNLVGIAVSAINPTIPVTTITLATNYQPYPYSAYDGAIYNNSLYLAYNGSGTSGVKMVIVTAQLQVSGTYILDASHQGIDISVSADTTNNLIWVFYYNGTTAYVLAVTPNVIPFLAPQTVFSNPNVQNITSTVLNGKLTFFYEIINNYTYDSSIPTHYVEANTLSNTGQLGTAYVAVRSVGLASKAFIVNSTIYFLATYQSPYQPTYFLIDGSTSTQSNPIVVARLAYQNGGGYLMNGLPNVPISGITAYIPYLYKDLIASVNKNTNVPAGSQVAGIYSQTGVNLVKFEFTNDAIFSTEIGSNLNLTGGFLWMYDGYLPVEQNFFLYPDSVEATWSTSGGSIHAQPDGSTNTNAYFYQVTYEWTDNQGNAFRSAPSIPISVTTTGSGTTGSITVNVPTLRLTYKISSPLKIVIYRWSVAQQSYYQVTSITVPELNNTTIDSISYVDTLSDSSILGNNLIYTTGGVVEDVGAPSSSILTLFDDRLWLVDAEDPNLLWYSKQVIEGTPVEMSDLFTYYVAPSTGAQGSTGSITALSPMDDKLIIFKEDAIYYINGSGPDNTGANSGYPTSPIFITSTVGCTNPASIVIMQDGLMFQSNKGIWLLGRDLSTAYIGAAVEQYNSYTVTSALNIPATNQIRFSLSSGVTLMYDYFVHQWGTFEGIPAVSGTLYQELHTIVNQYGQVSQETAGVYLDGSNPVLMSFTTSWLNVAGLRGYIRAYWFYLLGTYLSPHKLQVGVAYDYDSSTYQGTLINPTNYGGYYGSDPYYGGNGATPYGGPSNIEQWRIFLQRQRCRSFQITIQEVFDPSYGTVAGPGLTLSGLNCIVGVKKGYAPIPQQNTVG